MIQDLPTRVRTIIIIVLSITAIILVGLAVYGAVVCTPTEVMCPAPEYNSNA